jgi:serine/threonine-protein kinase
MGEIYKGHVIETGDPVAIKMMLPELLENEAAFRLFLKEASALHRIHHPAVIGYYFAAKEPTLQRPYLAMEFVDGRTLAEMIDTAGPLPFEAVQSLLRRLASGLQAAHEQNIIHRDISPDNIIISNNDVAQAKIIDFGIARTTQHGTVIGGGFAGKISYVSPEQVGLFGGDVTAKSDIYSLGLLLVEALNGKALDMGGSQFEMIEKRRKLPELGAIDMRLRPLLERMLQPDPANRPESMAAVAPWSFDAPAERPGLIDRKDKLPTVPRPARSWLRWQYAAGAAVALALICGGAGAFYFYGLPAGLWSASAPSGNPQSVPPLNPGNTAPRAEQIRNYIDHYNGGSCFFLSPVAVSDKAAAIEGFGASAEPFRAFDAAFRRNIGFEADIGVHEITQQQCPAAAFLAGLRGKNARAPRLDIDREDVHNGEVLSGLVDRYGGNQVALFLVSDSGTVQNVSSLLKSGTDAKMFNIGMKRVDGVAGRQPQLLIAVASSSPLAALQPGSPATADQFFTRVASEAAKSNTSLSAAARYFVLEN